MNNKCCFRLFAGSSCPLIRTSNWILNLIYSTKEKSLAGRNELNWHLHKNDFFQLMVMADVPTGEYTYNWIHLPTNSHPYRCLSLSRLRSTTNNCVTSERTSVCSQGTLTDLGLVPPFVHNNSSLFQTPVLSVFPSFIQAQSLANATSTARDEWSWSPFKATNTTTTMDQKPPSGAWDILLWLCRYFFEGKNGHNKIRIFVRKWQSSKEEIQ